MEGVMRIRPAAVAGQFYPHSPSELRSFITQVLDTADRNSGSDFVSPKALIVPHAGYIYSGLTAAYAYAAVKSVEVKRVVLLGPAHRVPFYGMALPDSEAFATPLGEVLLDGECMRKVQDLPYVAVYDEAHILEHSLEVQLPFLQSVFKDLLLIPLCIGSVEAHHVTKFMEQLWDYEDTLFVISSDLSHFHPYEEARELDRQAIDLILNMQTGLSHEQACGATGINALLSIARRHGMQVRLLDYRNSGDTAGDKRRVVGYASIAFSESGAGHE
jgi:AmmeMemoRadiSam system protein B